jgi:hypothetical protein
MGRDARHTRGPKAQCRIRQLENMIALLHQDADIGRHARKQ